MKSKEKILNRASIEIGNSNFENLGSRQPLDIVKKVVYEAMDIHARNVAVEFYLWLEPDAIRSEAEKVVTDFLQSEHLKERTEG
jgi:hypothetical protein